MMSPEESMKMIDISIEKKKLIADGHPARAFTTEDNMMIYDCVYNLCTQKGHDCSSLLYDKCFNCLSQRIIEKVLPAIVNEHGTTLLANVTKLWSEFKEFAQSVVKLFVYVDRFYVPRKGVIPLRDAPKHCFCDLVCDKLLSNLQDATMTLVIEERDGKQQMDRNLLKTVFDFFVEVGQKETTGRDYYDKIEQIMLAEAAAYYSELSMQWWFWRDSFANYLRKVDWCFVQEEGIAEVYPRETTKTKLIEVMRYILLKRNAKKLAAMHEEEGFIAPEDQELVAKYTRLSLD